MSGIEKSPPRGAAVRRIRKGIINPAMLLLAGRRHWYGAALHHIGRRSDRPYTTPVVAEPAADGFVIPLPYGTDVDWLRNIPPRWPGNDRRKRLDRALARRPRLVRVAVGPFGGVDPTGRRRTVRRDLRDWTEEYAFGGVPGLQPTETPLGSKT